MTDSAKGGARKKKAPPPRPAPAKTPKPAAPPKAEAGEEGDYESSAVNRAEDMVDHLLDRSAHYTGLVARSMMRFAARLREEAEDVWAEAQEVRRQNTPEK